MAITGLSNNVPTRPNTNSHSYDITIYAENSTGYTNDEERTNLNTLFSSINNQIYDKYGTLQQLQRYVRPGTIPNLPY
jgi:hypothetical protein